MNKLITCAGLAAIGAASLHAQTAEEPGSGKAWSVSAKLRGFYDSNYATAPSDPSPGYPQAQSSWGINFAPSVTYALLRDLTTINASYDFDMRWYEARADNQIDYTHRGTVGLSHSFSERYKVDVYDSIVYGSEPSVIEPNGQQATFVRSDDSAWRNYGGASFTAGLTEKFSTRVGYVNSKYDYIAAGTASQSALLDRMEQLATVDLRWQFHPTLVGLLGYQYGMIDYSSTDKLFFMPGPLQSLAPDGSYRNQQSNYGFAGVDYTASPQLSLQLRGGVNAATYPNADTDDILAPYVDLAFAYEYLKGCKVSFGVKNDLRPTDVATPSLSNGVTVSQEATTLYAMISHRITEKLVGSLRGSWQNGVYQGGAYDGQSDDYYNVDVNLSYEFNRYLSAETGYAYDNLNSDIPNRPYDRNRFYFGVKATY